MKLTRKQLLEMNNNLRDLGIERDSRSHLNCIKIHPAEGEWHFKKKCEICRELYLKGRPFLTESKSGNRQYDVVDLLNPDGIYIIEIDDKSKEHLDAHKVVKRNATTEKV